MGWLRSLFVVAIALNASASVAFAQSNAGSVSPELSDEAAASSYPSASSIFEFRDKSKSVVARGNAWFNLVPRRAEGGFGPASIVNCDASAGTCSITDFYDAGHSRIDSVFQITRWDEGRIEAERGRTNMDSKYLSPGYQHSLAFGCVILNRTTQQVFFVVREQDQTCRQLDELIAGGVAKAGKQLCRWKRECPSPPPEAR